MAKPPKISLENRDADYKYFKGHRPSRLLMYPGHLGAAVLYHPRTHFVGDSEERIREHVHNRKPVVMATTHKSGHDPFVLAAAFRQQKALRPLRARTLIMAKPSLFNYHPIMTRALIAAGAVPVWRPQDVPEGERGAGQDAAKQATSIGAAKVDQGFSFVSFPEGTRKKTTDPTLVQVPLGRGIGWVACGANPKDVLVVCGAIAYPEGRFGFRHAALVFDTPPVSALSDPALNDLQRVKETMDVVAQSMQYCLDLALKEVA